MNGWPGARKTARMITWAGFDVQKAGVCEWEVIQVPKRWRLNVAVYGLNCGSSLRLSYVGHHFTSTPDHSRPIRYGMDLIACVDSLR